MTAQAMSALWGLVTGRIALGRALWFWWAQTCPRRWRVTLVPRWELLEHFVHDWLEVSPINRVEYAMRCFAAIDSPYREALCYVGSMRAVFGLVEQGRPLTEEERNRFATPPFCMPADVTWAHIAAGTAGILSALRIDLPGMGE